MGGFQRWARDPPESLDQSDSPPFLSLDPSLEKGIDILKVSIPVSKKRSKLWKCWDLRFWNYNSERLDPVSIAKTQSRSSLLETSYETLGLCSSPLGVSMYRSTGVSWGQPWTSSYLVLLHHRKWCYTILDEHTDQNVVFFIEHVIVFHIHIFIKNRLQYFSGLSH